jgi:hypothetical protein
MKIKLNKNRDQRTTRALRVDGYRRSFNSPMILAKFEIVRWFGSST